MQSGSGTRQTARSLRGGVNYKRLGHILRLPLVTHVWAGLSTSHTTTQQSRIHTPRMQLQRIHGRQKTWAKGGCHQCPTKLISAAYVYGGGGAREQLFHTPYPCHGHTVVPPTSALSSPVRRSSNLTSKSLSQAHRARSRSLPAPTFLCFLHVYSSEALPTVSILVYNRSATGARDPCLLGLALSAAAPVGFQ